jgi:hypothetical protein
MKQVLAEVGISAMMAPAPDVGTIRMDPETNSG